MFGAFLKGKAINISTKHHSMNNSIPLFTEIQFSVKHLTKKKKLSTTQHMWKDFTRFAQYSYINRLIPWLFRLISVSPHTYFVPHPFHPVPVLPQSVSLHTRVNPYPFRLHQSFRLIPASPNTLFTSQPFHFTIVSPHIRFASY